MDIDIDCASLHYGMKNISSIETALTDLSSALGGITLDGELTTAALITKAIATVSSITGTTIPNVKRKLENAKNILINMDNEAALFFQYVDTGLLDENLNFTEVPLYDQRNYPKIAYSQGSIATSGCGLTAMCMALSYIYNDLITPDKLGSIANKSSSNNEGRMMGAAKAVGAVVTKQSGIYSKELRKLLREGKQVIVLVRNGGHFVLCTGVTDDGRILVNDPYGAWQKSTPYTDADLNKTGGSVWVVDPYANVGNAKTSIGRMKVSSAVAQAIKEANSGSGTVKISSKQYIEGVAKATKAKQAKNWKSIIGPTAIELQGGNKRIGGRVSSGASSAAVEQLASEAGKTDTGKTKTDTGTDTSSPKLSSDSGDSSSYSYDDGSSSYSYSSSSGSSSHSGGTSHPATTVAAALEAATASGPSATKLEKVTTPESTIEESTTSDKISESAKIFAKNNEILARGSNKVETTSTTTETEEKPTTVTSTTTTTQTPVSATTENVEPTQTQQPTEEVIQPEQNVQEVVVQAKTPELEIETQVIQTNENTAVLGSSNEHVEEYVPNPVAEEPSPVVEQPPVVEQNPVNNNEQPVSQEPEPSSILNNYHPQPAENTVIVEEPLNPRETEPGPRPNDPVFEQKTEEKVPNPVIEETIPEIEETDTDTTRQPVIYNKNENGELEEFDAEEMYERNKPTEDEPISSSSTEKPTIIESEAPVKAHKKTNNVATAVLTVGAIAGVGAASYATYKAIKKKE